MGGWRDLLNVFTDNSLPSQRINVQSPQQAAVAGRTTGEYDQARANPNYGMPTPELQSAYENELSRDIMNRTAAGSGGSGYQGDQVRKGLIDFRMGLLTQRQRALDSIRSGMVQAAGPSLATAPQDVDRGILGQAAKQVAGRGAQAAGTALFGADDKQQQSQQAGGAPGTTGYRQPDQQQSGGMKVT